MIKVGTTADNVLTQVGYSPYRTEEIGSDENGKIVRWYYMRYNLILKRYELDGVEAYRVTDVEHKPAKRTNKRTR